MEVADPELENEEYTMTLSLLSEYTEFFNVLNDTFLFVCHIKELEEACSYLSLFFCCYRENIAFHTAAIMG